MPPIGVLTQLEALKKMEVLSPKANQMLIVDLGNKKVGIQFRHQAVKTLVRGENIHTRLTHCGIFEIPKEEKGEIKKLAFGVAKCSEHDNFCKEKGRKVALTRALLQGASEFSGVSQSHKDLRGKVWEAYRNRGASQNINPPEGGEGGAVLDAEVIAAPVVEVPVVVH